MGRALDNAFYPAGRLLFCLWPTISARSFGQPLWEKRITCSRSTMALLPLNWLRRLIIVWAELMRSASGQDLLWCAAMPAITLASALPSSVMPHIPCIPWRVLAPTRALPMPQHWHRWRVRPICRIAILRPVRCCVATNAGVAVRMRWYYN